VPRSDRHPGRLAAENSRAMHPGPGRGPGMEYVTVRGVDPAVRSSGEGDIFIWGHGLLTSMAQEDDVGVFDRLRMFDHMRCIRYDARVRKTRIALSSARLRPSRFWQITAMGYVMLFARQASG